MSDVQTVQSISKEKEESPLLSSSKLSTPDQTYTGLMDTGSSSSGGSGSNKRDATLATTSANIIIPYTNNWNLWTVWNSCMMNLFNQDSIQNEKKHPMLHLKKEEFGLLATDVIRKLCSEFEPLGTNLMLAKVKKIDLSPQNDRILYAQDFFCYSKISQRLEIGIDEIMFTGISYDPTSKLVVKLAAYGELAQMLTTCVTSTDLIMIRGNLDSCVYDEKDKSLALNRAQVAVAIHPICCGISGDGRRLDIIRFPIDEYWRHYLKRQVLVEKITPSVSKPNFFRFTYTAKDEVGKVDQKGDKVKVQNIPKQKQYGKPKAFTLEDFLQRETSRRFTHHMELPFQIPISRGTSPIDAFKVLIQCDDLLSLSASATATEFKITPPEDRKIMKAERFMSRQEVDYNHDKSWDNISEDEGEIHFLPQSTTKVPESRSYSTQNNHGRKSANVWSTKNTSRCCTDEPDRRMHIVIVLLSLVLFAFAMFQFRNNIIGNSDETEMENINADAIYNDEFEDTYMPVEFISEDYMDYNYNEEDENDNIPVEQSYKYYLNLW